MTRKQIKSAASEAALRMKFRGDIHPSQQGEALFIDGAEWRINSVWHDVSERPKFPGEEECVSFLLLRKNGGCDWFLLSKCDWDDFMDTGKFVKWAYIDDFLPERKEETK